jgi:hypothetical protein
MREEENVHGSNYSLALKETMMPLDKNLPSSCILLFLICMEN